MTNDTLNEPTIREILAEANVYPNGVEANLATTGEWVVWYGMGHPVHDADDVRALAVRLAGEQNDLEGR